MKTPIKCQICKKRIAKYECNNCGLLHCEKCADINVTQCADCIPPELIPYHQPKREKLLIKIKGGV